MKFLPKPEILGVATLNAKGQMVIPKEVREHLGIEPGERVVILSTPFIKGVAIVPPGELEKYLGKMNLDMQASIKDLSSISKKL
jgi:AbrB family looped-hinge helix DNA binding protein